MAILRMEQPAFPAKISLLQMQSYSKLAKLVARPKGFSTQLFNVFIVPK